MGAGNELDTNAPLFVWASAECGHGVVIDTRIEHDSLARGSVRLELRAIERDTESWVNAFGDAVPVTCSLETGECTAHDHVSARFLYKHRWLKSALLDQLHHLRRRAARVAAQADRETASRRALANANPNAMIAYDELFPADWDLVVTVGGTPYWAVDLYCPNPQCTCSDVAVSFYQLETGARPTPFVGHARLEVGDDDGKSARVVEASTEIEKLVAAFLERHEPRLRTRYAEARRAILRFGRSHRTRPAALLPQAGRVPRNAMCPCGSGKKYKRCCIDARPAAAP